MMLNKRELYHAYYEGDKDDLIRKEILRYGTILEDESWEDDFGHWRQYRIFHETMYWTMVLKNGSVDTLYWEYSY